MVYYIGGARRPFAQPRPRISTITERSENPAARGFARSAASAAALAGLAAYPLLFVVQGIDFSDMGFNLSNQWLLLEDAGSYRHGHLFYLANLLGGLWLVVSAPLGLLGAKLGWALVIWSTMYVAYRTLAPLGGRLALLAGLVLALLWDTRIGTSWISYNTLTALFFAIAALALARGLPGERPRLVGTAGALLGAAIFVRFPNLLAVSLLVVVPIYARLSGRDRRWAWRYAGAFLLGYGVGVAAVLSTMVVLDHLPLYLESLDARLSASASDASYEYSSGNLLSKLLLDYKNLAIGVALFLPVLLLLARALAGRWQWQLLGLLASAGLWYVLLGHPYLSPVWFVTLLLAGVLALAVAFRAGGVADGSPVQALPYLAGTGLLLVLAFYFVQARWIWLVPGLLYVVLGFRLWRVRDAEDRIITVVTAMLLAITPLGSGNGMINAIFGMWLAIPLALMTLADEVLAAAPRPWYRRGALVVLVVPALGMLLVAIENASVATYRDSADRSRMTASPIHPYLRGVLTTPERARVVDELTATLPGFVSPGDPLLLHGDCPLVHLLSRTRPLLGSTWNGVYNESMFNARLHAFERGGGEDPVIVMSKGSCRDRNWPRSKRFTVTGAKTGREMREFMRRHAYGLVWQNDFFEIWLPGPADTGG